MDTSVSYISEMLNLVGPLYICTLVFHHSQRWFLISKSHKISRTFSNEEKNCAYLRVCNKEIRNDWLNATCTTIGKFQELSVSIHKIILIHL